MGKMGDESDHTNNPTCDGLTGLEMELFKS